MHRDWLYGWLNFCMGGRLSGIDVRKGSKNAGATNTIRVLGLLPGIFVLFIDALKGWFAVYLANFFWSLLYRYLGHDNWS